MYKKEILYGDRYITEVYDRALEFMPYASAGVNIHTHNGFISYTLRSYCTNILTLYSHITTGAKFLEIGCVDCSRTAIKHVKAFIKEYLPAFITYEFLKAVYHSHPPIMVMRIPTDYKDFNEEEYLYTSYEFLRNIYEPQLLIK